MSGAYVFGCLLFWGLVITVIYALIKKQVVRGEEKSSSLFILDERRVQYEII